MRQRVALARALIMERPILLMDEPFAALDAQTKIVMQEELLRIFDATHKTVLFVTHAIEEAILLGDEVVVMTARPGRIKEVIAVDLPRPRSLEMVNSQEFGALFDRIFHLIREEVMAAMAQQALAAGASIRMATKRDWTARTDRSRAAGRDRRAVRARLGAACAAARHRADLPAGAVVDRGLSLAHDRRRHHGLSPRRDAAAHLRRIPGRRRHRRRARRRDGHVAHRWRGWPTPGSPRSIRCRKSR